MLASQIGLKFPPLLGGIPERREEASLEPAYRMRLRKKIPVQLLRIDPSEISVGQSHKSILPSLSRSVFSRMANGSRDLFPSREYLIKRAFLVDERLNDWTRIVAVHQDHPTRFVRDRSNHKGLETRIVTTM